MSGRQKARICSDFCRLADAKPTCATAKTPSSLARTPKQADAMRGRMALQSVRELVSDSWSEIHAFPWTHFWNAGHTGRENAGGEASTDGGDETRTRDLRRDRPQERLREGGIECRKEPAGEPPRPLFSPESRWLAFAAATQGATATGVTELVGGFCQRGGLARARRSRAMSPSRSSPAMAARASSR